MVTANQKFKRSGTSKSFKEWLKDEQARGELEVRNKQEFINANGVNQGFKLSKLNKNMLILIGLGMIGLGYYKMKKLNG